MKYKIISLNTTFLFIITILVTSFSGALTVASVSSTPRKIPIYSVQIDDKKIAITFDAAWSADDTDRLIEILDKHDAKATIFCVGDWIRKNPDAVLKFHKAGHEIGNHSDTHPSFSNISFEKVREEIRLCNKEIENITGKAPKLCRAPSGDYDNKSIEICESMGMKMIQWDCDSLDYRKISPDEICNRILDKVQNGSIILFHNGVENTPVALDKILGKLKADGYEFVTVSEIIYWDDYKIDHTGRQIPTHNM